MNQIAVRAARPVHDRDVMGKPRRSPGTRGVSPLALLWLAALAAVQSPSAATTVDVLDTEPAGQTVTLGSGQTFFMRIAYSTDTPVRI